MHRNARVGDETEKRLLKAAQAPCDQTARETIEDAIPEVQEGCFRCGTRFHPTGHERPDA